MTNPQMLAAMMAVLAAPSLVACGAKASSAVAADRASIGIDPTSAVVPPGGEQPFRAVTATPTVRVTWQVLETGGGTVDASGVYHAPSGQGTFHVVVAEPVSGASARATVSV